MGNKNNKHQDLVGGNEEQNEEKISRFQMVKMYISYTLLRKNICEKTFFNDCVQEIKKMPPKSLWNGVLSYIRDFENLSWDTQQSAIQELYQHARMEYQQIYNNLPKNEKKAIISVYNSVDNSLKELIT